ncbi:DUF2802 domain-containing protein [Bowmanella sp. JS7-9]|uniref:DUF2802 domain-containing protein n=1 Tax=Pseudobowmanella zhangzhouensis TaxID=1537679 RepID=A0ABW1XJG0_9ALTE|nr:DUF2802 domain-containing protein [Bowmanella sp. JS7-9]TBX25835.1 hypothetical protein TK45_03945 [Bowmanella sp. JS7-9]
MIPDALHSLITLVLAALLVVALGLIFSAYRQLAELRRQSDEQRRQQRELQLALQDATEQIHETRTGSLGVGKTVRDLIGQLQQTQIRQEKLEEQDPDLRLYGKATRMAAQGASAVEIVQECELPLAEAELLVNLHKQAN